MHQTCTCMYRRKLLVFFCYILDYITVNVQGICMTTFVLKNPLFKVHKTGRYGQLQRQSNHRHVAVHFERNRGFLTSYTQHPFNGFGEETGWIVKLWCSFVNIMEWGHEIYLYLILLTWRIWWAPSNASRWQMVFNWVFKGLKHLAVYFANQQVCKQEKKVTDLSKEV
jgi:hypothetical protein